MYIYYYFAGTEHVSYRLDSFILLFVWSMICNLQSTEAFINANYLYIH